MNVVSLSLWCVISILAQARAILLADVAPPPGFLIAGALGGLAVIGIILAIIVLVTFLVIRGIRKKRAAMDEGA